jgi:hypothetical protein
MHKYYNRIFNVLLIVVLLLSNTAYAGEDLNNGTKGLLFPL